jgi:hypothetical protein
MCRRSCSYHMRRIRPVRHLLNSSSLCALVVAFVLGRIDYCSSQTLYAGCMQTVLQGLQRVQSTATATLLTGSGWLESALPFMQDLHWHSSIESDTIQVMHVDLWHCAWYRAWLPRGFVSFMWTVERLRSGFCRDYVVPFRRLSMTLLLTRKSFHFSGPRAWNSISSNVRDASSQTVFVNRHKTHLSNLYILEMYNVFVSHAERWRGAPGKWRLIEWLKKVS